MKLNSPFLHEGLPFLLAEAQKGPLSAHRTGNLLLHLFANAEKAINYFLILIQEEKSAKGKE